MKYDTTFETFAKIEVNGDHESPLYRLLKEEKSGVSGRAIKWNFTKFLLDRDGKVAERFAPVTKPAKISGAIEKLL